MRTTRHGFVLVLTACLAGCGGGSDDSGVSANPAPSPAPTPPAAQTPAAAAPSSTDYVFTATPDAAITAYTVAVAAGGDARSAAPGPAPACAGVTAANAPSFRSAAGSLDDLISRTRGTPCLFDATSVVNAGNQVLSSGAQNDWWTNAAQTVLIAGNAPITTAAGATTYYTTNTLRSVAFPVGGNAVTYLNCRQRYDGSSRNCTAAGSGSYSIGALSDGGRVLTLAGLPPAWGVTATLVFIEQGGQVYFGTKR